MKEPILKIRSRNYLPHWELENSIYFVTFRLFDSLPKHISEKLQNSRQDAGATTTNREILKNKANMKVQKYLDQSIGACYLKNKNIASLVKNAFDHFNNTRYQIYAYAIMPNRVHVIFKPLDKFSLENIIHSWKSFTAKEANQILSKQGVFWQKGYYDHIIRSEKELMSTIEYVLSNPAKAGLENWPWIWSDLSELYKD